MARRRRNIIVNFIIGVTVIVSTVYSVLYFLGKLKVSEVLEEVTNFLPAVLIGMGFISGIIIFLKLITRLVKFLYKTLD